MDELLKRLAALAKKSDVATEAMKAETDKAAKKVKMDELKAIYVEMDEVNAEIEEVKLENSLLDRGASMKGQKKSAAHGDDEFNASRFQNHKENVYDDPKLGFKHYGDVAMAVYNDAKNISHDPRLAVIKSGNPDLAAAGLRQGNGPDGGFLVPTGVRSADLSNEQGMSLDLYGQTRNFTLGQESAIEIPAINEKSRKDGSMYGGITANWIEEEEQIPESEPQFRQILLKPKELVVGVKVSNTLLRNSSIALGQFLDLASRDVMTHKLSDAVFNGDGNGKPKGLMQSAALIEIAKESGQTNLTVVVENTLAMLDAFTERWLSGAAFYINKRLQSQLSTFVIGDRPVWIPGGTVAGQPLATLHGLPVIKTEYNQILGDKGDIILTNLNAYITANHGGGIEGESSTHFLFDTNRTMFKFIGDADGQTWLKDSIEDFIGTEKSSPFVTLAERK